LPAKGGPGKGLPPRTARDMQAFVERGQTRLRQFPLPDKNPLLESLHHDCLRASGEANCKGGAVSRAELAGSAARAVDPAFRGPSRPVSHFSAYAEHYNPTGTSITFPAEAEFQGQVLPREARRIPQPAGTRRGW
jgi:hypothetical protein